MKKKITLLALLSIPYAYAYDVDCANIKEMYDRAQMYMQANRPGYTSHAVEMFQAIYDKCKDKSKDKETLGNTVYQIGRAHWHGYGVGRNYPKACSYFDELISQYADVADHNLVGYSQMFIADGARNALCEERNWAKAIIMYKKIIADEKFTKADIKAWAQARLGDAYREGEGIGQDYSKSFELFNSIMNDDKNIPDKSVVAWAKFWIADAHEHAKGVEKDLDKAHAMFTDIVENYKELDPIAVIHAQDRLKKMEEAGYKPNVKKD
ncbi:MAG: hypothetical protein ACOYT8_05000 [Candidatus Dependentiae bacterium]